MAILDYRGNPVDTSKLAAEVAAPSVGGVRQPFQEAINDLTPLTLSSILLNVDQGDATEYLTLAEQMEERDLHYASVLHTRKLAVSSLTIGVDAASDDKRDIEIADAVTALTKQQGFRGLMADALDALGKGVSVSEIIWDKSGKRWKPKRYAHRDARWFMFDRATGRELRLKDEKDQANGIALDPYKFVVHYPQLKTGLPIRGGLARLAVVAYMCKSYALKDWMVFAEVFGMPLRLGKYDTTATTEQKTALLRALTNIGTDAAAMIPDSMTLEIIASSSAAGGDRLFQGLADYLDSQVSKGVLGQTMTADNGSSQSQANVHNEVRGDIRDDDAIKLAATLHRDLVRPFVDLNWGPPANDAYPTLRLFKEEPEDLELFGKALTPFVDRGMRVGMSVIRDKFGLEEPAEDEEILKPASGGFGSGGGGGFNVDAPEGGNSPQPPVPPASKAGEKPEDDLANARTKAQIALLGRVIDGVELTRDQRALIGLAAVTSPDDIDALADEALDDWRPIMDPVIDPIVAMAESATSLEGLLKDLKSAKPNSSALVAAIAKLTMKSRGLGDTGDGK